MELAASIAFSVVFGVFVVAMVVLAVVVVTWAVRRDRRGRDDYDRRMLERGGGGRAGERPRPPWRSR